MINLLNAEFYKLRKSKSWLIGLIVTVLFLLLLYSSLLMIDKINQGELANGSGGVMVYQNGDNIKEQGSMMEQIGVIGVIQ